MKKLLKENFVLVVGVSLPVVVVVLFVVASGLPKKWVAPPRHSFVFTTDDYSHRNRAPVTVNFDVHEGRLRARVYKSPENHSGYEPKLYLYDHQQQAVRRLTVDLPKDLEHIEDGAEARVAGTAGWEIDTSHKAPDGYEFRDQYHRRGLVGEIFYSGSRRRQAIVKSGAVYPIPDPDGRYYSHINFLGWVVGERP